MNDELRTQALWDQTNHSVHGKECISCGKILFASQFRRDASYKEGIREQCYECETAPRLSTSEHVHRLRELSYGAARAQRWGKQQLLVLDEEARQGKYRHSSEIISWLSEKIPSLYFVDGNFIGDVSIYRTYGRPQPQLDNKTFKYLFYTPLGWMREFSIYEFDHNDVPLREKEMPVGTPSGRGWRTVLLRFIKSGDLTENQVNSYFGEPYGEGSLYYQWQLWRWRNQISE